jgi:4-hydroxy-tetrahydrodipicolinate synthase
MQNTPMIPALKAVVAHHTKDSRWANVRPPLSPIGANAAHTLLADLDRLGFEMPGVAHYVG